MSDGSLDRCDVSTSSYLALSQREVVHDFSKLGLPAVSADFNKVHVVASILYGDFVSTGESSEAIGKWHNLNLISFLLLFHGAQRTSNKASCQLEHK